MTLAKYAFATLAAAVTLAGFAASNEASALPRYPIGPIKCLGCRLPTPVKPVQPVHYGFGHWYWGHYRDIVRIYGTPVGVAAPVVVSAPVAEATNCLSKQYLPDGRALFTDRCTREQAVTEGPVASK